MTIQDYDRAIEMMFQGDLAGALERFRTLARTSPDDPAVADRARTWTSICERRLAGPRVTEPANAEERYQLGVIETNRGNYTEALRLLGAAMADHPTSPHYLYARASTHALKGNPDAAIADLRQALRFDPRLRHQAINDPDFEPIREEPSFIDLIEPTPTDGV